MFEVHLKQGKNGQAYWGMYDVERNQFKDIIYFSWRFGCGPKGFDTDQDAAQEVRDTISSRIPIYDADGREM